MSGAIDLDSLPPVEQPLKRLRIYCAARSAEEERALVEALMERRAAGEELAAHEERMVAYSPFGTGVTQRC